MRMKLAFWSGRQRDNTKKQTKKMVSDGDSKLPDHSGWCVENGFLGNKNQSSETSWHVVTEVR